MNLFSKIFIITTILVWLFKIEFFPFSNYQMYSDKFIPATEFKYNELKLSSNGVETPFLNETFGLYHSEQPLIEAIRRNIRAKGSGYIETVLRDLFFYKNVKDKADSIAINTIVFDWDKYKKAILADTYAEKNSYIKIIKSAEYVNDKN